MDQVTLAAKPRYESGTRPARRMRREGLVPAVVYGRGLDPVHVQVLSRELYAALRTEAGLNALINVHVDGGDTVLTVAREIQRHPVRGEITHLDFISVSLDEAIQADVSLDFIGTPVGVTEDGAIIETIESNVLIEALPANIPTSIELDVSEMETGDTKTIADLPVLEGVVYVDDEDRPVVTLIVPRIVEEEPAEVLLDEEGMPIEPVEGEEGEEAEAGEASEEAPSEDEG